MIFFFLPTDKRVFFGVTWSISCTTMEPPSKKMRKLLDEDSSSDSGEDAGGVSIGNPADAGFKINEEYAKRFEHNKKREEVQKRTFLLHFSL